MPNEVLALDLPGTGGTTDFGFLAGPAASPGAARLSRVDPLVGHVAGALTVERQARALLAERPRAPAVVVAYCAGATLAAHLAERAGARAVLVDPYPITTGVIHYELTKLCRTLGCEAPAYDEFAAGDIRQWETVLNKTRDGLVRQYGGDETAYEMVDGLLDRYRAWLRFLDASASAPTAAPAGALVIAVGPPPDLGALLTEPADAAVRPVDAAADPLGSPQVRALLSDAIDAAAT
ncbi:hypothetical protein [Streptomyces sp. G45]|uniref:hypothetical protein n=1 Tax=Streptomyces sp. G45 TaxID=3406627 RepID=UPI003C2876FA